MNINEITQKIKELKIVEYIKIWYISTFLFFLVYGIFFYFMAIQNKAIFFENLNYYSLAGTFILSPLILLAVIIPFIPAILVTGLIFQKTQNIKMKNAINIFSIILLFPLNTLIYNLFELGILYLGFKYYIGISIIINFVVVLFVLPIGFISYLIIPKSLCENKWRNLLTTFLTSITFILFLAFEILCITALADRFLTEKPFKEYAPTIKYIENYHEEYHKYPKDIEEIHFKNKESYTNYEYKTYNNNFDYVLTVDKEKISDKNGYRLCSDKNLPNCSRKTIPQGYTAKSFYGWIKTEQFTD